MCNSHHNLWPVGVGIIAVLFSCVVALEILSHGGTQHAETTQRREALVTHQEGQMQALVTHRSAPRKLVIVSPVSRMYFLPSGLMRVMQLRRCFEVHWVISKSNRGAKEDMPTFFNGRNHHDWIHEIVYTGLARNSAGSEEKNFALAFLRSMPKLLQGEGWIYFLDDDNAAPTISCDAAPAWDPTVTYFADQEICGSIVREVTRHPADYFDKLLSLLGRIPERQHAALSESLVLDRMDLGSWLLSLSAWRSIDEKRRSLQQDPITFPPVYKDDGFFFTKVMHEITWQTPKSNMVLVKKLGWQEMKLFYNGLTCTSFPWFTRLSAADSHNIFLGILAEMESLQVSNASSFKMRRREVSFHTYVHILFNLRTSFGPGKQVVYVEIGVWKGATSYMMSRHPMPTKVIGIDPFELPHQQHDMLQYKYFMDPQNKVQFIRERSTAAGVLSTLQTLLMTGHNTTAPVIDILFIDGDHSHAVAMSDFYTYAPLVGVGGYVVFDDFIDYVFSAGVRTALFDIIENTLAPQPDCFHVIGTLPNLGNAKQRAKGFPQFHYGTGVNNEFLVQVLKTGCVVKNV